MSRYPPYPAYRDSGIAWLGAIPAHWEVKRFRRIAMRVVAKNRDDVEREMLSLSAYRGVEYKQWRYEELERPKEDALDYNVVEPGQLVVNPMWVIHGAVGVSQLHGIVSPAYRVYNISDDLYEPFCDHLFRSPLMIQEYNKYTRGSTTYDRSVREEDFNNITLPLPPLDEQRAIAAYLDAETARLDALVAHKEQMIALLQERRTALINHAVTRGLDPAAPLRESGIAWLGAIPAHWEVKRLKYTATINPSKSEITHLNSDTTVSFLPMEKIGDDGSLVLDEIAPIEQVWQGYTYFKNGDVVVAKITPCFENGKGALCHGLENGIGFGTTELHVLRARANMIPEFLFLITQTILFRRMGEAFMYGAAGQKRVPETFIANLPLPLPPLDEQRAIAAYLDAETARIDAVIERTRAGIALLHEYRTALISAAVTGQIDVRSTLKEA